MGRKKTGLDQAILKSADQLFYRKGYVNTGINEIVTRAGTNKPGLYSYFKGKDELARRYLDLRNDRNVAQVVQIGESSADIREFFRRWTASIRDEARGAEGQYNGCPIANFALQTEADDEPMQDYIRQTGRRWQSHLIAYIRGEIKAGRLPAEPGAASIARRMLICIEGAITMWKMTGLIGYFDETVRLFEASLAAANPT